MALRLLRQLIVGGTGARSNRSRLVACICVIDGLDRDTGKLSATKQLSRSYRVSVFDLSIPKLETRHSI